MQSSLDLIGCQSRNQLETNPDYFWQTMIQVAPFHPAIPARKSSIAILSPRLLQWHCIHVAVMLNLGSELNS